MKRSTKIIIASAAAAGLVAGGTGLAVASSGGDDDELPITGPALETASTAALDYVDAELGQGGTVTDTEIGDEESFYEVEVTLDDGSEVDVQLDEDFAVVGSEAEVPGEPDDD